MDPAHVFDFSEKSVLIVGASRGGIGSAIASAFKAAGADVAITGVEAEPVEEDRGRYPYTQLDVTDGDAIDALVKATPKLDILVNCAAIFKSMPLLESSRTRPYLPQPTRRRSVCIDPLLRAWHSLPERPDTLTPSHTDRWSWPHVPLLLRQIRFVCTWADSFERWNTSSAATLLGT